MSARRLKSRLAKGFAFTGTASVLPARVRIHVVSKYQMESS